MESLQKPSAVQDQDVPRGVCVLPGKAGTIERVILRLEVASSRELKAVVVGLWAALVAAVSLLVVSATCKQLQDTQLSFVQRTIPIINTAVAALCMAMMTAGLGLCVHGIHTVQQRAQQWTRTSAVYATLAALEALVTLINTIALLVPNVVALALPCTAWSPLFVWMSWLQWSCWNALLLLWCFAARCSVCIAEATPGTGLGDVCIQTIPMQNHSTLHDILCTVYPPAPSWRATACPFALDDCSTSTAALVLWTLLALMPLFYAVLFALTIHRAFVQLRGRPYAQIKDINIRLWVVIRVRFLALLFIVGCVVVMYAVGWNSCASLRVALLGYPAEYVIVATAVLVNACLWCPAQTTKRHPILQEWLQWFAWLETEVSGRLVARSRHAADPSHLTHEPIFCFETAVKLWYWSKMAYVLEQQVSDVFTLPEAMKLYNLEHFKLLWEPSCDTKCLLGWNSTTIVIAFRGTASMLNVKADLQFWQVGYPSRAGPLLSLLRGQTAVHHGFVKSWIANDFNIKVIDAVYDIVYNKTDTTAVKVMVTGHSLGGSLAQLCSFDIARACPCLGCMSISCYTFGAPRTGNRAFAREYTKLVPDTFSIINDQDVVVHNAKFLGYYKRPAWRVILNTKGDMIVRPSFMEITLHEIIGGGAAGFSNHLLRDYQRALVAVHDAQFDGRGYSDGAVAMQALEEAHPALMHALLQVPARRSSDRRRSSEEARGRTLQGVQGVVGAEGGPVTVTELV